MEKTKISEHSKQLKVETSKKWKKEAIKEGGYNFNILITDKEIAEVARKIPNKAKFLREAIDALIIKKVS